MKGAGGAASTITPHSASPPTASVSPTAAPSPPQDHLPPRSSRDLPFPRVTDPEAPPIRPERHIPNSIATMRRRLIVALAERLQRCPCCARPTKRTNRLILWHSKIRDGGDTGDIGSKSEAQEEEVLLCGRSLSL